MSDLIELHRPRPDQTRATDVAVWQATHLRVRDLNQALRFWRDLLGLGVHRASPDEVALGVDDAELIVLHAGATRPVARGHAGLYHVALHLPSAQAFTQTLARLVAQGVDPSPTDHLLHWAMYLWDSDGIGVELSFETADRFDRPVTTDEAPGAQLIGTDGRRYGPVERLDVGSLLRAFPAGDAGEMLPPGTRVGHNHLHVADLDVATHFYERLGFAPNLSFMGMRDFNALGSFAHRLAINEWQGRGAPAAPADAAGLHHLQLSYATDDGLQRAIGQLDVDQGAGHGIEGQAGVAVADPSGNAIELLGPLE